MKNDYQIVILAGGLGKRLGKLTKKIPKPLIKVRGLPFLIHLLLKIQKEGIHNVILCVGYKSNKIISEVNKHKKKIKKINIKFIKEKKLLGTGGAIKNAEKHLNSFFSVVYSDSWLQINFKKIMQYYQKNKIKYLMTIYKNKNLYDKSNIEYKNKKITKYLKDSNDARIKYIDYGFMVFKKSLLKKIKKKNFDLSELIQIIIKNKKLYPFLVRKRFFEIGSYSGLKEFKSLKILND